MTSDQLVIQWSNTILDYLLDYRKKHPELTFWLRRRNPERLKKGYWFQGSHYIFVGFVNRSGNMNKTKQLGFVVDFYNPESPRCYLEVVWHWEQNQDVINCYEDLRNSLKSNRSIGTFKYQKDYINNDIIKNLEQFLANDKPIIDNTIKRFKLQDLLFIKPADFQKVLTRTLSIREQLKKSQNIELEDENDEDNDDVNFWWLNANPKYWNILDFKVGETQFYTSISENGYKRQIYENFKNIRKGDVIVGYQTTPVRKVLALYEVTKELHEDPNEGEIFEFVIKEFLKEPIGYSSLHELSELKDFEFFLRPQGSLFRLTSEEFDAIQNIIDGAKESVIVLKTDDYTKEEAIIESGLSPNIFEEFESIIKRRKQVIFQGPPGTGKSYLAMVFLKYLTNKKKDQFEVIQFHPSYSYEDFIEGYRPTEGNKGLELKDGIFKLICQKATVSQQAKEAKNYVILIDEINRGNLSKIFGELLYSLEYRDKRVKLTYSPEVEFFIPSNLYIIGTMNTADRSLAVVDYALRRRFSFISLYTDYQLLLNSLEKRVSGINSQQLTDNLKKINNYISNNHSLGKSFEVGHSYFLKAEDIILNYQTIESIWNYEISPLLEEYYFDNPSEVQNLRNIFFEGVKE